MVDLPLPGYDSTVAAPVMGFVHGNTVTLDAPVPPLDGKRVAVFLEPADEPALERPIQMNAWQDWVANGPQGPIEDDGEPSFP